MLDASWILTATVSTPVWILVGLVGRRLMHIADARRAHRTQGGRR